MLWSLLVTMKTHPGEIPLYWGFYIGDEDYKRKRYCLICNAFKPERSHHCSICNICVLNMDHHCPWVNNCIGFYNRKFFMQLLIYVTLIAWFTVISSFNEIFNIGMTIYRKAVNYNNALNILVIILGYGMILVVTFLISMFIKFHLQLDLRKILMGIRVFSYDNILMINFKAIILEHSIAINKKI